MKIGMNGDNPQNRAWTIDRARAARIVKSYLVDDDLLRTAALEELLEAPPSEPSATVGVIDELAASLANLLRLHVGEERAIAFLDEQVLTAAQLPTTDREPSTTPAVHAGVLLLEALTACPPADIAVVGHTARNHRDTAAKYGLVNLATFWSVLGVAADAATEQNPEHLGGLDVDGAPE